MVILVAGSTGLVGSAVMRGFNSMSTELVGLNRSNVDLRDFDQTIDFFRKHKPTVVIDAAARVGGIDANNSYPVEFLTDNISIQGNLMRAAHLTNVQKFVFLGSSCVYPRNISRPIKEEDLMSGPLESTNSAYAIAKISGLELVKSYRKQFGRSWISLMPTNLYGPHDNFNLSTSHVLPALVRRFIEAKENKSQRVILWGSGTPRREFLHVDDLVRAIKLTIEKYDSDLHLNIGSGVDISIRELSVLISSATDYEGEIEWDPSKPDGTPRKVLDVSRIRNLGWEPKVNLAAGIRSIVSWYQSVKDFEGMRK